MGLCEQVVVADAPSKEVWKMLRVSVVWVIELAVFHLTHGQVLGRSPARPLALRSGNSTRTTARWP